LNRSRVARIEPLALIGRERPAFARAALVSIAERLPILGALLASLIIALLSATPSASAETYREAVEGTASLSHFWPMGESSGSSFADAVGGANAEVLGGVTLGEPGGLVGDSSTSALFNGSSGAARASVDLSGTHKLTVEFWMKWSAFAEDDHLALEFTPNFNEYAGGLLVDPDASPGTDFAVSIGEGSSRNTVYFERPSAGVWHYYAFVLNTEAPAETEITPYVDGHAVSYTKTESGTGAGSFANSTLFWMSRDASTLFGAGSMQDLALYDTTLSASTIGEHYEIGVGGPKASFTSAPAVASAGVPVRLDASGSSSPGGSITDYAWDFNGSKSYSTDGGSSATLSHTFSSPGTYTVDLRVKDSFGETATVSHTITVGAELGHYAQAVEETTGVTHFWPMDESSGSSFADLVGGANAEALGGVTLGEPGGLVDDSSTAAAFNGSSGTARAEVDLSSTHQLTVEFWMKWKAFAEDDHLAMELTPNFNEYPGGFLIDPDASGTEEFGVGIGQDGSRNNAFFTRPSAEQWHYYAFTFDTTASGTDEITPYVDGRAVSYTKSAEGTGAGDFAKAMLYWMSRDASTLFGAGSMQDLALYDTTLSSTTIGEHYEIGEGGPTASFTSTPVVATAGVPVHFDASASSSELGSITDYAWDFDGSKGYSTDGGSSATLSHTFSSPGTYTVDLRVKDSFGVTGTVSHTVTVGAALGQYEQAVEETSDAAHFWPMDEASGSSFADVLDGANASLAGGVSLGEPGGLVDDSSTSAAFNGSSGAAHASVDLSGTHKLTIEFWMKWSAYAEDDHLALEFTPNFNEYAGGFLVDPDATPGTDFAASIGEGSSRNTVYFERPSAGAWHYYAFVLNTEAPAETEITPYIDGHSVSYTKTESGTGAGSFANSTLYWMSRDASTLFGAGSMQDLALYETTLSAGTILEHYERGENTYLLANTTAPSIAGTLVDGQTLMATPGAWSGATPVTYTYQWQSCNLEGEECEDIAGATSASYTLSAGDLESTVRVLVTATNPGGSAQASSAASAEVQDGAPSELQAPSISGAPSAGETLYANPGVWGGSETQIGYQWERCNSTGGECADVAGATGAEYKLGEGDVGKTLRVRVGASNSLGSLTALSPATEAIGATTTLLNTWAPSVAGTPRRGQTLTTDAGSWLGSSVIAYTYQWLRCDRYGYGCEEVIAGATESTYVPQAEDVGSSLRVRVSATEAGGTVSQTTASTQPIAGEGGPTVEEPPAISGSGLVGDALTAIVGDWSGEALTYTYQWERCGEGGEGCSAISGATASSYTLSGADAGSAVRVLVTAADGGGSTATPSPPVTVSAATLLEVAAPSISGEAELGQTLSADPGIWTGEESIVYTYQWQRCNEKGEACANVTGATESGYTAAAADVGDTLKVAVTASGLAGTGAASSAPTPVVMTEPMAPVEVLEPTIEGNPTTGETLRAQPGTWLGSEPITYTYQWQRCNAEGEACTNISGATGETYVLTEHDLEATIRVLVSASNSIGSASATTYPSEVVGAPGPPESSEGPSIVGTAKQGEEIFAANGRWSGSRPLTYTYRWERCNSAGESCTAIEGATKPGYTVASADVGSTLRIRVTVSNSRGSTSAQSAPASVASATETKVKEAIEVAEATDPSVLAPSTSASLEEQTVKPALSDTGVELTANTMLTGATVSKETPGEFAVKTPDGEFSLQPIGTAPDATTTPTIVNGAAAVFAGTATATDTIVRPDALGATALLQLRSAAAPSTFSWEVGLGAGQQLEELPNGSIAVTEPESSSVISGSLPEEMLETPKTESTEPSGEEGVGGDAAEEELESSAGEAGGSEAPPAAPQVTTSEITPKSGELHPQETAAQYETATGFLAEAKAHSANRLLMVIEPPKVMDAAGNIVPATLSAAGDTITMTVSPSETTTFPVTAATAMLGPATTGGTASFSLRYGLSDPKAESFEKSEEEPGKVAEHFDKHLEGGPLGVKIARDVISYNPTSEEEKQLIVWLKAVHKLDLEPYITFGVLKRTNCEFGKACPSGDNPSVKLYEKGIERVIKKIKEEHKNDSEAVPIVKIWGAWNEPDFHSAHAYDPLYKHPERAALLWKRGRAVLKRLGCNCTMVAGEFAEYDSYISRYKRAILHNHRFWMQKPHVWGFHDYHDLVNVSAQHPDLTEYAGDFVNMMSRGMGHPRIWLSEQGVDLNNGGEPTPLATAADAEELQRLAAHDFLHLHTVSELYIEVVDYYLYWGPSKEEEKKSKFDSGLLDGKEKSTEPEPQDPREAYCVIALGEEGCPPSTLTKAPVAGTTTASASTVLLAVNPGGLATKYRIEYGTTTAYGGTTIASDVTDNTGVQSETVTLSGLEPCTTYHYQSEAESSVNEGSPSLGGDQTLTTSCPSAVQVSAGGFHTCAVLSTGGIDCWGFNKYGQLGNGTTTTSTIPVAVSGVSDATAVASGERFTCAVLATGGVDCWGNNTAGQLGDGTTEGSLTPMPVSGISDATVISAGYNSACALLSSGAIDCWGSNEDGQLGDETAESSATPVVVHGISDATNVMTSDAYGSFTCATLSSGSIDCWGFNEYEYGDLGNGTKKSSTVPVPVSEISDGVSVSTGDVFGCALLSSGAADCWGNNELGTLGDGSIEGSLTPVGVSELSETTEVSAGEGSACALRSDGHIACWGWDGEGELGDGEGGEGEEPSKSTTPVSVIRISGATSVSVGVYYACAVLSEGDVDCWGYNATGQLGDGTTRGSSTPVRVSRIG
jgi:alpha-tubulin suppressor-like RCC1 family protein